jgi:hypothetical protein
VAVAPVVAAAPAAPAVPAGLTAKQTTFWNAANRVETGLARILTRDAAFDFVGHAPDKLGIGTKFTVSAIINVANVTLADIGGLEWQVISGAALPNVNRALGTIEAVANNRDGVKLRLVGVAGGLAGQTIVNEVTIPVVEPQSAFARATNGRSLGGAGLVSSFMDVDYWLKPDNVSFVGIEWQEPGGEQASLTGNMLGVPRWGLRNRAAAANLLRHGGNPRTWMSIERDSGGRRNHILQTDVVGNTFGTECAPGTFTWRIQWVYRVKNPVGLPRVFTHVNHIFTCTGAVAAGRARIEKLNATHDENY